MRTINQIIGENLKKIRELSGFTQEQIAKSIGIERSHIVIMKEALGKFRMIF